MNSERCRNLKEFKAYIEGFQSAKSGRPPNAIEWAEILAELRHVQVELEPAVMTQRNLSPNVPIQRCDSEPFEIPSLPKTYGHHR